MTMGFLCVECEGTMQCLKEVAWVHFVRCMNLMKVCTGVWMFNGLVTTHVSECGIDIQDAGLVSSPTSEFVWFNDCV